MNNQQQIYTYALISALKEENKDLFDTFLAFILRVVPTETFIDINQIQINLMNDPIFSKKIPLNVLQTIIKRAKQNQYIEINTISEIDPETKQRKQKEVYKLNINGIDCAKQIEQHQIIQHQIERLCNQIALYFKNRGHLKTIPDIYKLLVFFIRKNISCLAEIENFSEQFITGSKKDEKLLAYYIYDLAIKGGENLSIIKKMLYGSILSTVLCGQKINISELERSKIKPCIVFLDTNFILSLLDLHSDFECRSAKDLFKMLKNEQFSFNIFNITLEEIARVIKSYEMWLSHKNNLPQESEQNFISDSPDLYRRLAFAKKWSIQMAMEFRTNLYTKIENLGVKLVNISVEEQQEYNNFIEKMQSSLIDKKKKHPPFAIKHDLLVMGIISKKYRKTKVYKIEDAKAFFLTSDITLSRFNYDQMDHKKDGSICEVILDRFLSNILWLKNPQLDFPLETIIAANSRDLIVEQKVWEKFYEKLKDLYINNKISEVDVLSLLHNNYIEDILIEINEDNVVEKINDKFFSENIDKARKAQKEQQQRDIEEAAEKLREKLSHKEDEVIHKDHIINDMLMITMKFESDYAGERKRLQRQLIKEKLKSKIHEYTIIINVVFAVPILILFATGFPMAGWILVSILSLIDITKVNNWLFWETIKNYIEEKVTKEIENKEITDGALEAYKTHEYISEVLCCNNFGGVQYKDKGTNSTGPKIKE
jgi:hypothetical protein